MKKADRSKYQASSSARAAHLLSESAPTRPAGAAFGFGGYSGARQLQVSPPSLSTANASSAGAELEGTIGQHLRRLAKRDPTTRLKALQALKQLLKDLPAAEIEPLLLAWTPNFQRLVMDNARTVRMEACTLMGVLAPKAGRGLGRALKSVLGPWCLAQADPHSDTAKSALAAFRETFPGPKSREAVAYFKTQVFDFLEENVRTTPGALGDMHKETPEERLERHERVLASSLTAMRNLLNLLLPAEASAHRDEAGQDAVKRVRALLVQPGMLKKLLSSKSPVPVRSACCALIALLCKRAPDALQGADVAQLAPFILGSIDEKDAAVHPAMWDMLLSFVRAHPAAWAAVNAQKAIVPRLMALLRNACYGSAEVSFPAVLPYVAHMPKELLGPDPSVISQLLASIWHGWEVAGTQGTARAAAADCYVECLMWTISQSPAFTGGDHMAYIDDVLDQAFDGQALRAALGQTRASTSAAETVLEVTRAAGNKGDVRWGLELVVAHIGRVLGASLKAQPVPAHKYEKALKLLQGMHGLSSTAARTQEGMSTVFELAIRPVTLAVMGGLGSNSLPAPAAKLLSQVMQWQEGWESKANMSLEKVLGAFLAGPAEGHDAEALADLTLAAMQRDKASHHSLDTLVETLLAPETQHSAGDNLPNGHGHPAGSREDLEAPLDTLAMSEQHNSIIVAAGDSMASEITGDTEHAASAAPSQQLSRQSSEGKGLRKPSGGRLTHLCTLLSRVGTHRKQLLEERQLWQPCALGNVAERLSQRDVLSSHPHAAKALALLLRGDGVRSFLSAEAVSGACAALLPMLEDGLAAQAAPHTPCTPACRSMQRRRQAQELALSVLHVLDLSLFSSAVLLAPEGLRPAALGLLCAVFRQACLSQGHARHGLDSPPEASFAGTPEEDEADAIDLEAAARDVWEEGLRLADLAAEAPQDRRVRMREGLLRALQAHIAGLSSEQAQDAHEVEKCVQAAKAIMNGTCLEVEDRDGLIDSLLAPREGWPQYMMPSLAKGTNAASKEAATAGSHQKKTPETHGQFVVAFALALGSELGFTAVLQPSRGIPRSWVAVELLCFCEEAGLQQEAVALCTYLAGRDEPADSSTSPRDPLVEATLKRLFDHVIMPYLPYTQQELPYRALCKLLPDLINGSSPASATTITLLRTRLPQLDGTEAVWGVLQSVAPVLRQQKGCAEAALSAFAVAQMKKALGQPPLMLALIDAQERVVSMLTCLRTVTSCFPLAEGSAESFTASEEESTLLRRLAMQQLKAERSAKAAAAASKRAMPEPLDPSGKSEQQEEAMGAISQLQLCTVEYCWQQLSQDEWSMILHRTHESIAAMAVLLEDQAEAVVECAQNAATALAQQQEIVKPDVALAILQRLGRLRTPEAAAKLQPAVAQMNEVLEDPARARKLQSCLPWLEILACLLRLPNSGQTAGYPVLAGDLKMVEATSEALRVVWSGGVAAAVALSCGTAGAELALQLIDGHPRLWEAAAAILEAALGIQTHLTDSIQAVNTWTADTGVSAVSAAIALLYASVGHDAMHSMALRLVLSPSILPHIAQQPLDEEAAMEEEEENEEAFVHDDGYALLVAGGVHPLLAARAADTALPEPFVLAWALLLACMSDAGHEQRRRLGLTCGKVDSLTAELISMLVAVLPLEEAQKASRARNAAKQGSAPSAAQAAAAAAAARAAGPQTSLSKEMLRFGVPENDDDWEGLAAVVYRAVLQMLPASAMSWFGNLRDRSLAVATEAYTALRESPGIIAAELAGVSGAGFQGSENGSNAEFRVRANLASREASAILCIEDNATLEMTIKLPAAWPLRPADVECKRKVGVTEGRLRKWLLSIAAFLRSQNGGLADAMRLWRDNCVREFAGVEECLICYSVIAAQDGQLPRMICSTCSKGFHRACLYKWFRSSHKSVCPHCQSPW